MIKFITIFILSFFILSKETHAQDDTAHSAKVYIIRATGEDGALINFRVAVDDEIKCKIKNNRYKVIYMDPGKYTFYVVTWAQTNPSDDQGLTMELEAGKIYYLRMIAKKRYFSDPLNFEEITYNSAMPLLKKYKEQVN
jgi:hypothetical protein